MKSPSPYRRYKRAMEYLITCGILDWIRQKERSNFLLAYNNLAWIYGTSPNASLRNGDEAVALATKACELTNFKNPEMLDTFAAAYAEMGKFEKAVEYQQKAIALAPSPMKKDFQTHLQFYEKSYPCRDQ